LGSSILVPFPVAAPWACGYSLAGIVGLNATGGMDVSCECCVLPHRGLCVGLNTHPEKS